MGEPDLLPIKDKPGPDFLKGKRPQFTDVVRFSGRGRGTKIDGGTRAQEKKAAKG